NRLVQTRVTDKEGRFAFFVQPGQYFIKVVKPNFSFPSNFVKDIKEDVKYLDIYHGEEITVTEKNTLVTPNIPIDPAEGTAKPDKKIVLAHFGRKAQNIIAPLGIVAAAISVIISPQLWMVAILAGHCLLYALFRRLARSKKPKSWGIVYENQTKAPVGLTVARIFETEYNKLLETQVTDGRGRYSFLVGNNAYYVTFSKPGFAPKRTETIDLRGRKEGAAVGLDVGIDKI
ncbi:MAG: carboxypeptidase-like regulatory domain-containing protein, partial [Negativicutes bacterium]